MPPVVLLASRRPAVDVHTVRLRRGHVGVILLSAIYPAMSSVDGTMLADDAYDADSKKWTTVLTEKYGPLYT